MDDVCAIITAIQTSEVSPIRLWKFFHKGKRRSNMTIRRDHRTRHCHPPVERLSAAVVVLLLRTVVVLLFDVNGSGGSGRTRFVVCRHRESRILGGSPMSSVRRHRWARGPSVCRWSSSMPDRSWPRERRDQRRAGRTAGRDETNGRQVARSSLRRVGASMPFMPNLSPMFYGR